MEVTVKVSLKEFEKLRNIEKTIAEHGGYCIDRYNNYTFYTKDEATIRLAKQLEDEKRYVEEIKEKTHNMVNVVKDTLIKKIKSQLPLLSKTKIINIIKEV